MQLVEIKEIFKTDIEIVLKDQVLLLRLLKLYSTIYLNGSAPRTCERSIRSYYLKLANYNFDKMENLKQTFKAAFVGLRFIPGVMKAGKMVIIHKHIDPKYLSDKEAIELLTFGALKESDFEILPAGYKVIKPTKEPDPIKEPDPLIENDKEPDQLTEMKAKKAKK